MLTVVLPCGPPKNAGFAVQGSAAMVVVTSPCTDADVEVAEGAGQFHAADLPGQAELAAEERGIARDAQLGQLHVVGICKERTGPESGGDAFRIDVVVEEVAGRPCTRAAASCRSSCPSCRSASNRHTRGRGRYPCASSLRPGSGWSNAGRRSRHSSRPPIVPDRVSLILARHREPRRMR